MRCDRRGSNHDRTGKNQKQWGTDESNNGWNNKANNGSMVPTRLRQKHHEYGPERWSMYHFTAISIIFYRRQALICVIMNLFRMPNQIHDPFDVFLRNGRGHGDSGLQTGMQRRGIWNRCDAEMNNQKKFMILQKYFFIFEIHIWTFCFEKTWNSLQNKGILRNNLFCFPWYFTKGMSWQSFFFMIQ